MPVLVIIILSSFTLLKGNKKGRIFFLTKCCAGESIDIALSLVSPAILHLNATYSFDLVGVNLIGLAENGCRALRLYIMHLPGNQMMKL